jgi:2-oxoglutarate dehydrogenase E1 component
MNESNAPGATAAPSVYQAYQDNTYLFGGNAPYVEEMYENYLANPGSVPDNWRDYFDALQHVPALDGSSAKDVAHLPVINAFAERAKQGGTKVVLASVDAEMGRKRTAVQQLIAAYRNVGARWADLDPLKRTDRDHIPELDPSFYGFNDADQEAVFNTSNTFFGKESMSLRELMNALRQTYCGTIGAEYMYATDQNQKRWWQQKLESIRSKPSFDADKKKHILDRLTASEGLERFLHTKYVGQKRFSLEGGESFIASMDELIQMAGARGVQEIVIGMAHRGRLNVLANIMGKSPQQIFREFADMDPELHVGRGDVKYHLGYSKDHRAANGRNVHLTLCFNPSHLEFVNPVAIGRMRARQDKSKDNARQNGMVILIHGDAAFAGEGIIQETLNLSELEAYRVGGTLHVIVNNQIGFTTGPRDSRSCTYATDVAKMLQIPIFHVNGEDPEAVAQAVNLAMDFRREFQRDVVIDMYCFRRRGHNEADEPAFTQPALYRVIERRPSVHESYLERLLKLGDVKRDEAMQIADEHRAKLDSRSAHEQERSPPNHG